MLSLRPKPDPHRGTAQVSEERAQSGPMLQVNRPIEACLSQLSTQSGARCLETNAFVDIGTVGEIDSGSSGRLIL